ATRRSPTTSSPPSSTCRRCGSTCSSTPTPTPRTGCAVSARPRPSRPGPPSRPPSARPPAWSCRACPSGPSTSRAPGDRPRPGGRPDPGGDPVSSLAQAAGAELDLLLADADRALARGYPGDRPGRQPVHTVYVPADRYGPDLPGQWGRQALQALHQTLPQAADISGVMGIPLTLAGDVQARVAAKLAREPVE